MNITKHFNAHTFCMFENFKFRKKVNLTRSTTNKHGLPLDILSSFILFFLIFLQSQLSVGSEICNEDCAQEAADFSCLSRHVYNVDWQKTQSDICNGYSLVDSWVVADSDVTWYNASLKINGLKLGVYSNSFSGKQVIAFAGTQSDHYYSDWVTDFFQNVFYAKRIDLQYISASEFVKEYKKFNPNIILTGHSLGGGLATWASYNTDNTPAYIFNPALVAYVSSPLASGVKAYISANPNVGIAPARDVVSGVDSLFGSLRFAKEYFVPIKDELTNSTKPNENVIPLHAIENLENALYKLSRELEPPPQLIYPTPIKPIIATNSPAISFPGGDAMLQKVQYGTPNGTFLMTICRKTLEGCKETWTYNCGSECRFGSDGSKTITYTPSSDKQVGYYEWWVTDQTTGAESNKGFYFIKDDASPEPWYGYYGSEIVDTTPPPPECLPDFVSKRAWITKSENGEDKYVFESGDKAWINVKVKNEGCANSPQDISVWYLLSKGEKEDNHHDWVKVGTDTIRDYELAVGQDKWEKEEFTVPTEPGKYNIVVCADRVALYDNGDGAVREEHKSNDCSTEAVFTVLPKNNAPVGYFDSADCNALSGWAKDPDTSNPVFIRFYKDGPIDTGTYIGSTFADTYRADLPYTDKNHGFSFALPDSLNDGAAHQIYAYAIDDAGGINPLLTNSPKTVQCGLAPDQLAAVMSVINEILMEDVDSDGDGILDSKDNCPSVSNAGQKNTDSDSSGDACDSDDDNDGVSDISDAFPLNPNEWADTDGDGVGNNADPDDDNDGVADGQDAFPLDPSESKDADGDGIGDNADPDDDNDGIPDALENQGNTFLPAIKFLLR